MIEFQEKQKDKDYIQSKMNFKHLHVKLAAIKKLVYEYDTGNNRAHWSDKPLSFSTSIPYSFSVNLLFFEILDSKRFWSIIKITLLKASSEGKETRLQFGIKKNENKIFAILLLSSVICLFCA